MSCLPEIHLVRAFHFQYARGTSPTSECIAQIAPEDAHDEPYRSCPWLTDDWKSYVHPEGALYLYNDTISRVSIQSEGHTFFHGLRILYRERTLKQS
jgi:hypothetical protein